MDNRPRFVSSEFQEFTKRYGFRQVNSSPHFPQTNREAENAVKIAKKLLSQEDPHLALLNYRSTVYLAIRVSPTEALVGRRLQTCLPRLAKQLHLQSLSHRSICKADEEAKKINKADYDRCHGTCELASDIPSLDTDRQCASELSTPPVNS